MDCFVEHFFDETFCRSFISIILSVSTSGRDSTNKEPLHIYRERGRSWIRPSPAPSARVLEMDMTNKAMASGLLFLLLLMNVGKQLRVSSSLAIFHQMIKPAVLFSERINIFLSQQISISQISAKPKL